MFKMFSCLLLLTALLLAPSAPQQQTKTVDQKLAELANWLSSWKVLSSESQSLLIQGQIDSQDRQVGLRDTLEEVVAEAVGVKAQLEELLVDFAELVKIASDTEHDKPVPD